MIKRYSSKGIIRVAVALLGLCCCVGHARVVSVNVSNGTDALAFFPATTNITAGDSVLWTWFNINHSVSNTAGLFFSKVQGTGTTYTNTFNSAGTFPYQCTIHHALGMTGSIIVAAAPSPPTLAITNPVAGMVFAAPANVSIQATVTNGSVAVTNVQFLIGAAVLTNVTTAPFFATTNNLAAGSYMLFAIARDDNGLTATNSVNIIVDAPPSVIITNPASGTVLAAPASVTIQVSATDSDGSVTNVQFLVGSNVLTNKAAAPFSAVTNNLAAGSYTLSAVASDNHGIKATNTASISVVTPVTVSLTNSAVISGTNFQFRYLVNTGLSYVVQRSTNLAVPNWISLATNVAASNPVVFVDIYATNNPGFYRVERLPNP